MALSSSDCAAAVCVSRRRPVSTIAKEGRYVLPGFGLCGRCGEIHSERDLELEILRTCIPCQAELIELALELHLGTEVEG